MDIDLVGAFEQAVNAGDAEAAAALVTEDVEVAGPRGSASGVEVFRRWVAGSGIALHTQRYFSRDVRWPCRLRAGVTMLRCMRWRPSSLGELAASAGSRGMTTA